MGCDLKRLNELERGRAESRPLLFQWATTSSVLTNFCQSLKFRL